MLKPHQQFVKKFVFATLLYDLLIIVLKKPVNMTLHLWEMLTNALRALI